jgi:putative phosphoribosyl transferase
VADVFFRDRTEAGVALASSLGFLARTDVVVLGLPRGGVPVAYEVAHTLHAPLDVIVVRKVGVPYQPEFAMGAIGENGVRVVNEHVLRLANVSMADFEAVEAQERRELERRAVLFRGSRAAVPLQGRTALVVDDGVATGATARAACEVARAHGAARVVFAAPVGSSAASADLRAVADEVVVPVTPDPFFAVGQFYDDFRPVTDDDVVRLLEKGRVEWAAASADPPRFDDDVSIAVDDVQVEGHLTVPEEPRALVVFAHGSGSSRHSPRNRFVASVLNDAGLGSLLFDLLTPAEELERANVFDVELLARRLARATAWVREQPATEGLPVGFFGASTGAAAALWAATTDPGIGAVVSRGGRPDLAGPRLSAVRAPTLLLVGSRDQVVLRLNEEAAAAMRCEHRVRVVRGASHLFDEPGTLGVVAALARDWFVEHLCQELAAVREGGRS